MMDIWYFLQDFFVVVCFIFYFRALTLKRMCLCRVGSVSKSTDCVRTQFVCYSPFTCANMGAGAANITGVQRVGKAFEYSDHGHYWWHWPTGWHHAVIPTSAPTCGKPWSCPWPSQHGLQSLGVRHAGHGRGQSWSLYCSKFGSSLSLLQSGLRFHSSNLVRFRLQGVHSPWSSLCVKCNCPYPWFFGCRLISFCHQSSSHLWSNSSGTCLKISKYCFTQLLSEDLELASCIGVWPPLFLC